MSARPDNRGGDRDAKGRLKKGHKVGAKTRFPPGESPNPGGRPGNLPGFRQQCRDGAQKLLQRILDGDFTYTTGDGGGGTDVAGLVKAFEALADRGGFLPADKQAGMLLKALESPALTGDDRKRVIDELVGPPEVPALPPVEEPTE